MTFRKVFGGELDPALKPVLASVGFGALGQFAFFAFFAVWALVVRLTGNAVPGWTSITLPVLFLGAVQLLCLGVLGEYVGRVYDEVKRRPLYRVEGEPAPEPCPACGALSPARPRPGTRR